MDYNSLLKTELYLSKKVLIMKDINDIMPKIPNMKWGALMNRPPTNEKVDEMNKIFPHNGKWHTVFEEEDQMFIDGKRIWKKELDSMT